MVCLSKNENMGQIKKPKELDFLPSLNLGQTKNLQTLG